MSEPRLCANGCGTSINHLRSGAKWCSKACAEAWSRAHPSLSRTDARIAHVAATERFQPTRSHGVRRLNGQWVVIEWPPAVVVVGARTRKAARRIVNDLHMSERLGSIPTDPEIGASATAWDAAGDGGPASQAPIGAAHASTGQGSR